MSAGPVARAPRRLPVDRWAADRLTFDDDLFLRARRVLGVPVVNQAVWRFAEPVPAAGLRDLHAALARGSMTRLLVTNRVPGARARWVPGRAADPEISGEPVPDDGVLAWAEERAHVDLDPERGPSWVLAAARTASGEGLLSLVASHVVCDGGAYIAALVAAVERTPRAQVPSGVPSGDPSRSTALRDDLRDAVAGWGTALRGVVGAVRASGPTPDPAVLTSAARPPVPARGGRDAAPYRPATVVLALSSAAWHEAARAGGGTGNSLLVAVATETLAAAGRVPAGSSLSVVLPVDTRPPGDLRSNATTGVPVVVDTGPDGRVRDLAHVRARAKTAFAGAGSHRDPLEPVLHLVPDRVVARVARGSAVPLCLCSNLGVLPEGFRAPLGVPATAVLVRAVTQRVTPDLMRSRRGGLSVWVGEHGDTMTLAVLGMDPDCWVDSSALAADVAAVLERRGLDHSAW